MSTGGNSRGLGRALHLLLDGLHGEGTAVAFAIPQHIALRRRAWMLRHTLLDAHDRIGRHVDAPIFAPFTLHDGQGLLLPVNMVELEPRRLQDTQPAAEHHQKQGPIHRVVEAGEEPLDLFSGEGFGQGPPMSDEMTRLDGIARDQAWSRHTSKKCFRALSRQLMVAHDRPC
jgi:hypothetical protein